MSKQAFDKKLEALEVLRSASDPAAAEGPIRKALKDRNNYFVSKAAALAADLNLVELIPDLLAAFDRFMADPEKTDKQCWAKTAIARALKDLGHRDADVFVRGFAHIQLEPVWGGRSDSAITLRGTCLHALVDCRLDDLVVLTHLAAGLADPETPVRVDAASAIAQFGRPEGAPLLRLKALLGDEEPEVTGQCFVALLGIDARESVPFIGGFLNPVSEDLCLEAASALAQSREPEAIRLLSDFWKRRSPLPLRRAVATALGASPLPEAAELLLSILTEESGELAGAALAALAAGRFRTEMRERISAIIDEKEDSDLSRAFAREFPKPE